MTQEEADIEYTIAQAELARAHARLMNAQADQVEREASPYQIAAGSGEG